MIGILDRHLLNMPMVGTGSFTNEGHLSVPRWLSINVVQVNVFNISEIKVSFLLILHEHDSLYLISKEWQTCGQLGSFGTSNGQVQEAWERDHKDHASIWQVYSSIRMFAQIVESWKECGNHLIGFLYNATNIGVYVKCNSSRKVASMQC